MSLPFFYLTLPFLVSAYNPLSTIQKDIVDANLEHKNY
jgi:hypothetical protein